MRTRVQEILGELRQHLPYTLLAAMIGVVFMAVLKFEASLAGREAMLPKAALNLFHSFHFSHLFLSAIATTAMFWRYERRIAKAVWVGIFGTILLCGASDIVFPFVGGRALGVPMEWHLCVVEHPVLVLPFVLGGVAVGFALPAVQRSTLFSHAGHVILSSSATMLYLLSFGVADWLRFIALVFALLVLAVMIPCCMSDIVFPLLFTRRRDEQSRTHALHRAL